MRRLCWALAGGVLLWSGVWAPAAVVEDLSTNFDYFANSWGLIGLKDYPDGCRITPEWVLRLGDGIEGRWLLGHSETPVPRGIRRTLPAGLPFPQSRMRLGRDLEVRLWALAVPLPKQPFDFLRANNSDGNFVVLTAAEVKNVSRTGRESRVGLRLTRNEQGLPLERQDSGDVFCDERLVAHIAEGSARVVAESGIMAAECTLGPGETHRLVIALPYRGLPQSDALVERFRTLRWHAAVYDTLAAWARLLRVGSDTVVIPETKVRDTYFASLAYTFIGRDNGRVHPGEGFYDGFFLRDGAYQVWALEVAGYLHEARPSALDFLNFQRPNGQFESQSGELDGNGQALWQLVRHYQMTHDEGYLRQVYPAICQSMAWLARSLRRDPLDPDAAFAGVLPRSWADGEALPESKYHVVGYDLWNLRGARCAAWAAEALGEIEDAKEWRALADQYQADLMRLIEDTGVRDLPPSLELAGTDWGNLESIYPTPLFEPFAPRVSATFAQARRTFVEGTIRWCPETQRTIHPYMSTFITNSEVIRGEQERAVQGLYAFLLHSTSDHGFPEGVYYESRVAWGDTIPHLWAAAQYVLLVRNMLVREWHDELHFASAVPPHWLDPGKTVAFERAPTYFGWAGLRIEATAHHLRIRIKAPPTPGLRRIVVHTPPCLMVAGALARAGVLKSVAPHELVLAPGDALVEVRIERRPCRRCDYSTTVARFLRTRRTHARSFVDVLRWPLDEPVRTERCVPVDLRHAANVNPLTAPFGTANPGRYLFTGLPTGRTMVQGIPFDIIDPANGDGKAFIVLQGSNTSADFPRTAAIPIRMRGTRAFFLGQVTGWSPHDPGDAKTGSVGKYVLVYTDGSRQIIPLVSGQTVDDWAMPPSALLSEVGLRGDPWHLSVLAVKLRPQELSEILFEDTGTPAAPLLAAITVERVSDSP